MRTMMIRYVGGVKQAAEVTEGFPQRISWGLQLHALPDHNHARMALSGPSCEARQMASPSPKMSPNV